MQKFGYGELVWDIEQFWSPCRVQTVEAALRSFFEKGGTQNLPDVQLFATAEGKYVSCGPSHSNAVLLGRLLLRHFSSNGKYKEDEHVRALLGDLELIPAAVVGASSGQTQNLVLDALDDAHNMSEMYGRPTLWSFAKTLRTLHGNAADKQAEPHMKAWVGRQKAGLSQERVLGHPGCLEFRLSWKACQVLSSRC